MIPTGIIVVGSLKIQGAVRCVVCGMATTAGRQPLSRRDRRNKRKDRRRQTIRARGDDPQVRSHSIIRALGTHYGAI